jgi:hypothetical protein
MAHAIQADGGLSALATSAFASDKTAGPKASGSATLGTAAIKTPAAVISKAKLPATQDMHTMSFGLPIIPDPTGGALTAAVDLGEAALGGGGGGDAAAAGGAVAGGSVVGGTSGTVDFGTVVIGGGTNAATGVTGSPVFQSVFDAAKAAGTAAAHTAQATSGTGGLLGVFGGVPAGLLVANPGAIHSIDDYERGATGRDGLGHATVLLPGAYRGKKDGPIGQKKQFLTGTSAASMLNSTTAIQGTPVGAMVAANKSKFALNAAAGSLGSAPGGAVAAAKGKQVLGAQGSAEGSQTAITGPGNPVNSGSTQSTNNRVTQHMPQFPLPSRA